MSQVTCNDYFSVWQLNADSRETELFHTTACVPNKVKLAIFIVLFIIYTGFLVATSYLLYRHHHGLKRIIYSLVILTCLGQMMSLIIFMAGVQSRWKFLAFIVPAVCNRGCVVVFVSRWYKFLNNSAPILSTANMTYFRLIYQILFWSNIAINVVSVLVFIGFGPIGVYDDALVLNLFYIMGIITSAVAAITVCIIYLYIGKKLLNIFNLKCDMIANPEVEALKAKIEVVVGLGKVMLPLQLAMFIAPLCWYIFAPNNDISGIFYFHFCVMSFFIFCSLYNYVHTVTYKSAVYGSSNSSSPHSSQLSSVKA